MPSGASNCVTNFSFQLKHDPSQGSPPWCMSLSGASSLLQARGSRVLIMGTWQVKLHHMVKATHLSEGLRWLQRHSFQCFPVCNPGGNLGTGEVTERRASISEQAPELILPIPEPHATAVAIIVV